MFAADHVVGLKQLAAIYVEQLGARLNTYIAALFSAALKSLLPISMLQLNAIYCPIAAGIDDTTTFDDAPKNGGVRGRFK
ncbi:hypothetical protein ACLOJK_036354 [Asimina triloba]